MNSIDDRACWLRYWRSQSDCRRSARVPCVFRASPPLRALDGQPRRAALRLHAGLESGGIPHAFGGAIALADWTLEPRGTRDIDVNLFVPAAPPAPAPAASRRYRAR